jgi:hypothetical protein
MSRRIQFEDEFKENVTLFWTRKWFDELSQENPAPPKTQPEKRNLLPPLPLPSNPHSTTWPISFLSGNPPFLSFREHNISSFLPCTYLPGHLALVNIPFIIVRREKTETLIIHYFSKMDATAVKKAQEGGRKGGGRYKKGKKVGRKRQTSPPLFSHLRCLIMCHRAFGFLFSHLACKKIPPFPEKLPSSLLKNFGSLYGKIPSSFSLLM